MRALAILVGVLLSASVALGQDTPTETPTATETPTKTSTPTQTGTPTATPTAVAATRTARAAATQTAVALLTTKDTHVHTLELTLEPLDFNMPQHADLCVGESYSPAIPDTCRCVMYVTRIGGTNALKVRCPDGVIRTIKSW